jgi:uncharacterized protein YdeI (YjbR/CyaY-like superfamily)
MGAGAMTEAPKELLIESVAELRGWLAANHESARGVWVTTWKKDSGEPYVPRGELVDAALAYGWIDSRPRKVDEWRTALLITPRKPTSAWSRVNKDKVEMLIADGRMAAPGLKAIERAKANGSWEKLDDVEAGTVPDDLEVAFDRHPGAREQWDAFPRSARRAILEWIAQAKARGNARAKRVTETAELASRGERANQWRSRTGRSTSPHPRR